MEYLIDRFKSFWNTSAKTDIDGYVLMTDSKKEKSLVLYKKEDHLWKSEWINTSNVNIHKPLKAFEVATK